MIRTISILAIVATLAACATKPSPLPPRADVIALIEVKPKPPVAILTDPAASDRHNNAIEAYADRLSSAGKRLCAYFAATGMDVDCGGPR